MTAGPVLGVVGGGAAAVCLLDAVEQTGCGPGELFVFESSPQPWRGRPYRHDLAAVRVNIPPEGMSVRAGDDAHFIRWLASTGQPPGPGNQHHDPLCGATFVPRSVFGDYLAEAARSAVDRLTDRGWRVELVPEHVDLAVPSDHGVLLGTSAGRRVPVDYALLCVGVGRPADSYFLTGADGFIPDPYPLADTVTALDPDAEVAVIGSGLTAVDTVLSLVATGHRGRIQLLSRSGALPAVRQRVVPTTLRRFTADRFRTLAARGERTTLAELITVMRAELAEVGADPDALMVEIGTVLGEDPAHRLRRQLAEVDSPDLGLRVLQRAVPATGPDVWHLLPAAEQAEVVGRYYRAVMSLCCPMPPASAHALVGLLDSGRLELVSGVRHIGPLGRGGFGVVTDDGERRADAVINAVNPPMHRIGPAAEALVASLVNAGRTVRHPLGGVRVTRATSGLTADGVVTDTRLYALGDLARGSLFFTFGLPSIVDRAHDIARAVVTDARRRPAAQLEPIA